MRIFHVMKVLTCDKLTCPVSERILIRRSSRQLQSMVVDKYLVYSCLKPIEVAEGGALH